MKRLAVDTSSVACTVALQIGDQLYERHAEQAREHTRLLLPMIREILDEAQISLEELDAIVLGNGPGSFIGMRIAASVCQGLAHAADIGVVPVSSLAAVAAEVFDSVDGDYVAVAQDAHMSEVYLGLFSRSTDGMPLTIGEERLHGLGEIVELPGFGRTATIAAGSGWERYPQQYAANEEFLVRAPEFLYPKAKYLLTLSTSQTLVDPVRIEPAYLRNKVAEKPAPQ